MIKEITSRKNQLVLDTISLKENKVSSAKRLFIVEGEHLFEMALKAKKVKYVFALNKLDIDENIEQYIVTKEILEKISDKKSVPHIIAVCEYLNDSIDLSEKIVYLDNVQDPGNVGTILRSGLAFSYFNFILGNGCATKYSDKVVQASQGAIFSMNIQSGDVEYLKKLKANGYKIVVTLLDKEAVKLSELKLENEKVVFVFGNEGQGVSKEIISLADKKVFIEMGNIDSLNVGVAASILMYRFK